MALIAVLGVWFGYLKIISGSVWLPSFAHAVFNAHAYGVWIMIWPDINPLIGGKVGIIALVIYSILALIVLDKVKKQKDINNI